MNNVATISRPQLAVLTALHALLGCATVEDIGQQVEATTCYTRSTSAYIVEELVALAYCWREGNVIGLSEPTCRYLEEELAAV